MSAVADPRWAPIEVLDHDARAHQGSAELTEWCPTCLERVVVVRDGSCGWCDTPLLHDEDPPPAAPRMPRRVSRAGAKRDRRHNHGQAFTAGQIVARIQLWARVTGERPAKRDWSAAHMRIAAGAARGRLTAHLRVVALYEAGDWPSDTTVREHFGSWNAALAAAGFEPRPPGRPARTGPPALPTPTFGDLDALCDTLAQLRTSPVDERAAIRQRLYELAETAIHLADKLPAPATDPSA